MKKRMVNKLPQACLALLVCIVLALEMLPAPSFASESGGKWSYTVVAEPQFEDVRNFSEGLAAVRVDGKWGYIDASGEMVIEPQFVLASDFSGGIAAVTFDEPEEEYDVTRWGSGVK